MALAAAAIPCWPAFDGREATITETNVKRLLISLMLATLCIAPATAQMPQLDPANTLVLTLKTGRVVIQLRPDFAPGHVERVKTLVKRKFYDGLKFHRVIDQFMAQTGDPKGNGSGGSDLPDLKAEFSKYVYRRGTIGAARTQDPNSANSQFFICFTDTGCRGLTGQYTVWGQVVSGMEHVDLIAKGEPPARPDTIVRLELMSDAKR